MKYEIILLKRAIDAYKFDQAEINTIIEHINNRKDYINNELGIEFIGGKIRVSFLDEKIECNSANAIVGFLKENK